MEKVKDKGIHFTAGKITEDIKKTKAYHNFYSDVQLQRSYVASVSDCSSESPESSIGGSPRENSPRQKIRGPRPIFNRHNDSSKSVSSSTVAECDKLDSQRMVTSTNVIQSDFKKSLLDMLQYTGKQNELKNTVYHWMRQNSNYDSVNGYPIKEPLAYLRKAQVGWERRVHKSLNTMCNDLNTPLSRPRLLPDREELEEKWGELGQYEIDLTNCRPVYAPKDFLDVILWVRSPNFQGTDDGQALWDITQLPLQVKTMKQMKTFYMEIARGEALLGVNPIATSTVAPYPSVEDDRTNLGERVVGSQHAPIAREFAKRGCPKSLRARIWALALDSATKDSDRAYFYELKEMVLRFDLMTDKLILKDIFLTASNDDQFFVFQDVLYQVLLLFSRDTEVLAVFDHSSASPIHAILKSRPATVQSTVVFPPSGVVPFHGFTMYAAQFCYLFNDPVDVYFAFRAFYVRYFFRLHEVSSHQQGLLCLCILFERMLQQHERELWFHLRRIKVEPIRLTFKWLMRAFSGHLHPEQVLLLWDLIVGYDSLEILPLLAVSIMSLRKENLMNNDTLVGVEAVLADLSSVEVMPLIQLALLRDTL